MSSEWWPAWWAVAAVVASLLALWWRHYSRQFARRGLPYCPPLPVVGNMLSVALRTLSFSDVVLQLYRRTEPHPVVGIFSFTRPFFMVRHPDLVRAVTVKDFDHFTDRSELFVGEKANPLSQRSLFSLKGKKWHGIRTTLSPAFTSMKMKNMFLFISEIGQQMVSHLKKETEQHSASTAEGEPLPMEMKDFFTRIANDVIATTAFGLRVDSLSEPENEFYRMGRTMTKLRPHIALGYFLFPKLMDLLRIPLIEVNSLNFFKSIVTDAIRNREAHDIVRQDMLHLLMQARRGELTSENSEPSEAVGKSKIHFDEDDIVAQALIFFFAGFETVATAMSFCSFLLAINQDAQRRLLEEVDELMEKSGGHPSYEQVLECQYLDMVISETLRMYVPVPFLHRRCVAPYRLSAVDGCPPVELQPGEEIWLPVHAFHHDERYFPNPERFQPERFSADNKNSITPFTYFPFGSGPRFCIAQRFALLEMKIILLYFLSQFSLDATKKTIVPLVLDSKGFNLSVKGGFWLGVSPRKQKHTTADSLPTKAA